MAYDHGVIPVVMTTTAGVHSLAATATTAVKRFRYPVAADVVVKGLGIINLSTKGGAPSFSFRNTATAGASSVSGTEFARITMSTGQLKGKIKARKGLNTTASAGSEIVAQCRSAVTGYTVGAVLYIERRPSDWANKTSIVTLVTT